MSGSIMDQLLGNPTTMGLLGMASGFGQAAAPSRMPVPLGVAFGSGAEGMMGGLTNAAKLRALAAAEQQRKDELALRQQKFGLEQQQFDQGQELMRSLPAMFGMGGGQAQTQPAAGGGEQSTPASPPANAQEFIERYAPHALAVAQETGLDPRLVLAQAGLESGWGKHAPGNNLFGIKGHGQTLATQENVNGQMTPTQASFRAYGSPEQSFQDYAAFIKGNPRYAQVMGAQGLDGQIDAMGRSGYATDPNYAGKLRMLARGMRLPDGVQPAAQPAAQEQPQQPTESAINAIAGLPPQAQANIRKRGEQMFQQASAMQLAAAQFAVTGQNGVADILKKRAEMLLQENAWMPVPLANGLMGYRHAFTGEVKTIDQPRTVESWQNGRSTRMLDQPGVQSDAAPMTPMPMMQNGRPALVEPNSGAVRGTPILSEDQIKTLPYQPGAEAGGSAADQARALSDANTRSTGARAGAEAAATNAVKSYGVLVDAAGSAAKQNMQLDRALQAMQSFDPGPTADWKVTAGRWASVLGVEPKNTSEGEILKSIQSALQIGQVRGEGQVSNFERQILAERAPILFSTPDGARKVAEYLKALNQYDIGAAAAVQQAVGSSGAPDPKRMNEILLDYRSKNPPPPVPDTAPAGNARGATGASGLPPEGAVVRQNGREYIIRNGQAVPR